MLLSALVIIMVSIELKAGGGDLCTDFVVNALTDKRLLFFCPRGIT